MIKANIQQLKRPDNVLLQTGEKMRHRAYAFILLGLMAGCATTSATSATSTSSLHVDEPLPPPLTSFACRAQYNGTDVMYLTCAVNLALPGDTGTCDMQYVTESTFQPVEAEAFVIDCHDTTSTDTEAAATLERNLEREILEAYADQLSVASGG
ncbi:MAG: hypothetical protein U0487_03935 [Patescibacteria group bacterium]